MLRELWSRAREWLAVEDADERIDGSGEAIVSPQHRRTQAAQRELDRLHEQHETDRRDEP